MKIAEIKRIIFFLLKFGILFIIIDSLTGLLLNHEYDNQKSGKYYRILNTVNNVKDSIIIFGSSRANRHYVPTVISDSLNLSCYNAGIQGQGILFNSAIHKIVLNRYKPKCVILNIDYGFLEYQQDKYDRLSDLYPLYAKHKKEIEPILYLKNKYLKYILNIKSIRYNSMLAHFIKYRFRSQKDIQGYRPLFGNINGEDNMNSNEINNVSYLDLTKKNLSEEQLINKLDLNFVDALNNIIAYSIEKQTKLILVLSPTFNTSASKDDPSIKYLQIVARKFDVPFIDFSSDSTFLGNRNLFYDYAHLNSAGAEIFSGKLSQKLKSFKFP